MSQEQAPLLEKLGPENLLPSDLNNTIKDWSRAVHASEGALELVSYEKELQRRVDTQLQNKQAELANLVGKPVRGWFRYLFVQDDNKTYYRYRSQEQDNLSLTGIFCGLVIFDKQNINRKNNHSIYRGGRLELCIQLDPAHDPSLEIENHDPFHLPVLAPVKALRSPLWPLQLETYQNHQLSIQHRYRLPF